MITTEAPAEAGFDLHSELGNVLAPAVEEVIGGDEASLDSTPSAPVSDSATPPGEAPTQPDSAGTPAPTTPPGEGPSGEFKLTEDGSSYLVPKDQFPSFSAYKQYASEVQNWFPTTKDAQAGFRDMSDLRAMYNDYLSPDVNNLVEFLGHFAGEHVDDPNAKAQYQRAFERMAQNIPEKLRALGEQAYEKFETSIVSPRIERAYTAAADAKEYADNSGMSGDQEYAALMLKQAQHLDWGLTGTYKAELPKIDKAKIEADRLAADRTAFEERQTAARDRDYKSFNQIQMDGPKWTQYWSEIDKTLAPIKDKYSPVMFEAAKDKISKEMIKGLSNDSDWARMHDNEREAIELNYRDLWNQHQPSTSLSPRVTAYQADFMNRVRRLLPSVAKSILEEATKTTNTVKTANTQRAQATPPRPRSQAPAQTQQPAAAQQPQFYSLDDDPAWQQMFEPYRSSK